MSGSWSRNNEKDSSKEAKEGEGSGWTSTFLKVAGAVAATAAVAGSLYSILNQPEADVAPYGVQQTRRHHQRYKEEEEEEEMVILHVDGSLLRKISSAGVGGYLSSASEKWICGFTQKLDLKVTPYLREDETERLAILRGLLWVKEKGKKKVVVKTDNQGIANLVNSERGSNDPLICDIRDLLKNDQWEASLSWISGGENAVADRLAHIANSSTSFDLQEIVNPPQNCLELLF